MDCPANMSHLVGEKKITEPVFLLHGSKRIHVGNVDSIKEKGVAKTTLPQHLGRRFSTFLML